MLLADQDATGQRGTQLPKCPLHAHFEGVIEWPALDQENGSTWDQAHGFRIAQESGLFVRHLRNRGALSARQIRECGFRLLGDAASGRWDGVAMRINLRMAEQLVEPVDEALGNAMFETIRLRMNLIPAELEYLDQKGFEQSVASQDRARRASPAGGEGHISVGPVSHETGRGQPLQHCGDAGQRDLQGSGQAAGGRGPALRFEGVYRKKAILLGRAEVSHRRLS